jgi:polygalacturonase
MNRKSFLATSFTLLLFGFAVFAQGTGPGTARKGNEVIYERPAIGAISRNVAAKLDEIVSVKDFGAKCDNSTIDTVAIQAAVTYLALGRGGQLNFPYGTCVINAAISVRSLKTVLFRGDGIGNSILRQTNGSADGVVFDITTTLPLAAASRI